MRTEGPSLNHLMLRLRNSSPELSSNEVDVYSVLCDFLRDRNLAKDLAEITSWSGFNKNKNQIKLNLILHALWLFLDPALIKFDFKNVKSFLNEELEELSGIVKTQQILLEPDRTEEFVRRCLRALMLRPLGENMAQSEDRLKTLDSIEIEVLEELALEKRLRAQKVLGEMQRAAATAAAAKVSRE